MIRFQSLQSDIQFLQRFDPNSPDLLEKQDELNQYLSHVIEGAIVRSRYKSQTLTDAPTNYFFSLENNKGARQTLTQVRDEMTGEILHNPSTILKFVSSFFGSLYCPEPIYPDPELFDSLPTLCEHDRNDLDAPFSIDELDRAVSSLSTQTSPGLDGLTCEFYKAFWPLLRDSLFEVFFFPSMS